MSDEAMAQVADEPEMAWHREGQRDAAFRKRRLDDILLDDHRTVSLGMEITELDAERIVVEQTVGPSDVNGLGICHGGVVFTLADSATGIGANTLDDVSAWVTVTSEIHFRSPARIGDRLAATCELIEIASPRRRTFETVVRVLDADATSSDELRVVSTVRSVMVRLKALPEGAGPSAVPGAVVGTDAGTHSGEPAGATPPSASAPITD